MRERVCLTFGQHARRYDVIRMSGCAKSEDSCTAARSPTLQKLLPTKEKHFQTTGKAIEKHRPTPDISRRPIRSWPARRLAPRPTAKGPGPPNPEHPPNWGFCPPADANPARKGEALRMACPTKHRITARACPTDSLPDRLPQLPCESVKTISGGKTIFTMKV